MQDFGGLESSAPGEGGSSASEQVSEEAKQRFAQAQQQIKQIRKEEKKARGRDDKVANTIRQFLADDKHSHLFQLISRLTARDCPSVFILALLSLIHKDSKEAVEEYIAEQKMVIDSPQSSSLEGNHGLRPEVRKDLLLWIARLQVVLSLDAEQILMRLMVDESNIDGTVLQLTTFVLVDYFEFLGKAIGYEQLQPMTIKILQDVISPHMDTIEKHFERLRQERDGPDEKDE